MLQTSRLQTPVSFPKDGSEWFSFLNGNVDHAIQVREFLEELPDSAATFKTRHLPDAPIRTQDEVSIVKLMGAWKAPEHLFNNGDTWVNPFATNAHHYSDAVVKCKCGIPVVRQHFSKGEPQPTNHQSHKESCNRVNKAECRYKLLKNHKEIIDDQLTHFNSVRSSAKRLGYESKDSLNWGEIGDLGIDIEVRQVELRQKFARTCIVLTREYAPSTIAKIFDVSQRTISEAVKQETTADPNTLYRSRITG